MRFISSSIDSGVGEEQDLQNNMEIFCFLKYFNMIYYPFPNRFNVYTIYAPGYFSNEMLNKPTGEICRVVERFLTRILHIPDLITRCIVVVYKYIEINYPPRQLKE